MKVTQRLLYKPFFAVFLLFVIYGCQTTNNAVTSEPPVTELTSDKTESEERIASQANTVEKETSATSVTTTEETATTAEKEAETMKKFGNNFIGRLQGHGGSMLKPVVDLDANPVVTENRPYIGIEKKLYGKWINKIETESYDFRDDGFNSSDYFRPGTYADRCNSRY